MRSTMMLQRSLPLQSAIGVAGTSIAVAAYYDNRLGEGVNALRIAVTISMLCMLPVLARVVRALPRMVSVLLFGPMFGYFIAPVVRDLLVFLFMGHRRENAHPVDGAWRVFAILALWIAFAKVNETYIRPWLRKSGVWSVVPSNGIASQVASIAQDRRDVALQAIKTRLTPIAQRKKREEASIAEKGKELETAHENVERTKKILAKGEERLSLAKKDSEEYRDLKEEVQTLASMVDTAQSYEASLISQIEKSKKDIKECKVLLDQMRLEWMEALHIENHVGFYR